MLLWKWDNHCSWWISKEKIVEVKRKNGKFIIVKIVLDTKILYLKNTNAPKVRLIRQLIKKLIKGKLIDELFPNLSIKKKVVVQLNELWIHSLLSWAQIDGNQDNLLKTMMMKTMTTMIMMELPYWDMSIKFSILTISSPATVPTPFQ